MGEVGFIFGGLLNKKNKRRLLTQTEKKKRIKKRNRKQSTARLTLPRLASHGGQGEEREEGRAYTMQPNGRGLGFF